MPKGTFLIGWDNIKGSFIEAQFPSESVIESSKIIQYLVTIQSLGTSANVQINDGENIILLFGIPVRTGITKYDFIVIILEESEKKDIPKIQLNLNLEGEDILKSPIIKRKENFLKFAQNLYQPKTHKIVFIGYPNVGKTTTKMFFFEKLKSKELLETSIPPTMGFETSYYEFIDLNLAIFDSSGQELGRWLNKNEKLLIESDLIIFFFNALNWAKLSEKIKTDLIKLRKLTESNIKITKNIVIFCHKFDLIIDNREKYKADLISEITTLKIPVFFTSIKNDGNQDLIKGLQLILKEFSPLFTFFNNIMLTLIEETKVKPLFLMDSSFEIISNFSNKFIFDESKQIRRFILKNQLDFYQSFQKHCNFFVFSLNLKFKTVICINMSILHPNLSYFVINADSFSELDRIHNIYLKIKRSFDWESKELQIKKG
ncbi:MAG: GTPase domain-containing protein [Promethearchaeota archaeon]